jgi:putative ABC transport system permease protein
VILNEAAVRELGWDDPLGKWFEGTSGVPEPQRRPVVGVVRDFNFTSLHEPIVPTVFYMDGRWLSFMYMRITGADVPATLAFIEVAYAKRVADRAFTYSFLEDRVHQLYQAEEHFFRVFSVFTGLAIGIACLGIFGLATFMGEVRKKEIGVRKVLGAPIAKIVLLLSREFTGLVLAAVSRF